LWSGNTTINMNLDAGSKTVTLNSSGAISASSAVKLTAGTVNLSAVNGINTNGNLTLAASTISATNTTSGCILLNNTLDTAVTVTTLSNSATTNGTISFTQSGNGTVTFGTVTTNNNGKDISLASGTGGMAINTT